MEGITGRLRELELELLQNSVRKDGLRLQSLLAEAFVEFGSSGRVFTRAEIIETLAGEEPIHWGVEDFSVVSLAEGVALVTYRAVRAVSDAPQSESLRSSLWVREGDRWRMRFHQGTRIPGDRA